ncbi:type IV pilin protein [Chitiniphilus purpureus]|uniref:type IV pilin protein n=1 Tax=Chitiniphilus purpureus TaxID=2981137 RepID=UPI0027E42D48|nr:type IV pilin protein [Chitiniphilus sp. CD1]
MRNRLARSDTGFTLIELMITVAILGILAAIAVPSYQNYVLKSRRADAQTTMQRIAQAEEKWRANNPAYTNDFANLGLTATSATTLTSESQHYNLTIHAEDCSAALASASSKGTAYCIKAAAQGRQLKDSGCTSLTLTIKNGNTTPQPAACWSK